MPELHNLEILRSIVDALHTGVCVLDRASKICLWNQAAARCTGYLEHEVIGRSAFDIISAHVAEPSIGNAPAPFSRVVQELKPLAVRMYVRHRRGHLLPLVLHIAPIRDEHNALNSIAVSFDAQGSRVREESRQQNAIPLSGMDIATGIANHRFTQFHLKENLESFAEYRVPFGVLRVRPQSLERIRAAYGREAEDSILLVIAQSLSNRLRPNDFVGRWADEEFLGILVNCGPQALHAICQRMQKNSSIVEIRWWGQLLSVKADFGCASVDLNDTIETLLQRAEQHLLSRRGTASPTTRQTPSQMRSSN